MKQDFTIWRNQILQNPQNISPLKFGISQDEIIEIFGNPDVVSTMRSDGKPLILKYHDIELHFDRKAPHGLYLVYSDDEIELSITDHHEELLQPITNIEPVKNASLSVISATTTRRRFGSRSTGNCMRNMSIRTRSSAFRMCLP